MAGEADLPHRHTQAARVARWHAGLGPEDDLAEASSGFGRAGRNCEVYDIGFGFAGKPAGHGFIIDHDLKILLIEIILGVEAHRHLIGACAAQRQFE